VDGKRSFATMPELINDKVSDSAEWLHQREHSSPTLQTDAGARGHGPQVPGCVSPNLTIVKPRGIAAQIPPRFESSTWARGA
jgi:hypothetical protein